MRIRELLLEAVDALQLPPNPLDHLVGVSLGCRRSSSLTPACNVESACLELLKPGVETNM